MFAFPDGEGVAPPCTDHVLTAVHAYTFCPAGALVFKNNAPIEQVAGSDVPVCMGFVELAAEKSTLLLCVRRSTCVWAAA